ncbi:MAG: polyphosphate kinase 1 [Chloroflexi bacterium]|nr:polyphosphate kinase 1 [Chloroflexota bacterium]MBK6709895.1 polyphosphate kinase 1 [Chloroflexota bacterium]MBK7178804.1 polyphosphate kinase 1 [Chloroflexota bacterium]MBK7918500.1 polyphosphate kinase 1 [Chloroflexota bacterium]MBP6804397.1 polyphosphate kinase 1 [Chloroflexota bacterium]
MERPMSEIDLSNPSLYINRELSHIEFNRRVLHECYKEENPLLERVKFLAIFTSNMDELFMVRVSGLKQQVLLGITRTPADGLMPREQLVAVYRTVTQLFAEAMSVWRELLHPALAQAKIHVLDYDQLKKGQQSKLRDYFEETIFPVLTPLAFDPGHPFPHISNLSMNLAVVIRDVQTDEMHFARVKVPASLPRLVPLKPLDPDELLQPTTQKFVWVEQVIAANLDRLFPGMQIVAAYPFRVTRNTDMEIQEEEADDLLLTMEKNLRQRHFGFPVRLEIDENTPDNVRDLLLSNLQMSAYDVYTFNGPLGLSSLWELHKLERPELKDPSFRARYPASLQTGENIFQTLQRQDLLLHHPYDSFAPVIDFIRAAAEDPDVLAIKQTLYRVGPNPPIVQVLMRARENGKQVSALVELKARFDEESNIEWARALENAGVHVVYGLIGLKTHCKLTLVVRRERDGIRRYVHVASGNYNNQTSRLYTDLGMITSLEDIGADASELFNYLTGYSKQTVYRQFLVAPVNLRANMLRFIEREIAYGERGRIIIKANSLVDPEIIQALYEASAAGVQIDLLIRGICCLRPGLEGVSDNIRVASIVGRFLEHSRIYYFHNEGAPDLYVGSADLMPRNIDRRVEILFPIEDQQMRRRIVEGILEVYLKDTANAWLLRADGRYTAAASLEENKPLFNSQKWFLDGRSAASAD